MSETIAFTRGVPPAEAFPTERIATCFDEVIRGDTSVVLQYGQQAGYPALRQELAAEYNVDMQEVMVSNGSLSLQDLVAAHLIKPGDTVLTEQPSYDRAIMTFRRRGAQVIGIPLEADGISVERLEAAVKKQAPAFIYLVPDFQNPAGATLSLEKRRAVIDLANRYNFWVIEDIPYRKLRYQGENLPMLREIDAQRTITMSSFSKLLSPGMRVGYMVAPAALVKTVTKIGEDTYLSPVLPTQAAVAEFIKRGWLDSNIEDLKTLYRPRWETMTKAAQTHLKGAQIFTADGGFFLSVMLPGSANTKDLVARAKERNLLLTAGQSFFADSDDGESIDGERFVRLPFCAVTPEQINEGMERLAGLL